MAVCPLDPRYIRLVPLQLNRQGLLAEPSTLSKGSEVSSVRARITSVVRAGHASDWYDPPPLAPRSAIAFAYGLMPRWHDE